MTEMGALRVLVVLPLYGGSLPVGRYCCSGLRALGHVVETFEAPDFHPSFQALKRLKVGSDRLEYLENSYLQVLSQAILAKVESFEPDLVLAMAQAPLSRQALKRLRRDKVATAMWFVEDYNLFTYWRSFASYYDIFAVIQKGAFTEALEAEGVQNHLYLPLGADPAFHRPVELSSAERREYGSDISFVGAGYPNRRRVFAQLLHYDFKIWGSDWEGEVVLAGHLQRKGRRIDPEEAVKIFNASKINLNLHSSVKKDAEVEPGDFVNPRTFELAACGGFQLVDSRELMPELFRSDELAMFSSLSELKDMIDHFLEHPKEREVYARRARQRVLGDHTYAKRMQALLGFAGECLPDWPRQRVKDEGLSDFPEDVRRDIRELIDSLGLPQNVAFKDLVWAIRSRKGTLSPTETAVLFLDEWRKQYKTENE